MITAQNNDLQESDQTTPIYLGGGFALLFAADAMIFLQNDRIYPSTENKVIATTFALASLFLIGITVSNLREVGMGSLVTGIRNTLFGSSGENQQKYLPVPTSERSTSFKAKVIF